MNLVILGAGGYASTIKDIAEQLEYKVIAMLDDKFPEKKLSSFNSYISDNVCFVPAFGDNQLRLKWCNKIKEAGGKLITLIHPTSYVSPTAIIEEGTTILPKAVINTKVEIGKGCIINLGAIIDHDVIIEDGCHICLGAIVKGDNRISTLTKIEAGEIIQARKWPV